MKYDLNQLSKKFLEFETKNKLFKNTINSFYYWDYIRYSIHVELSLQSDPSDISYIYKKKSFKKKIVNNIITIASLFTLVLKNLVLIINFILNKPKYDLVFLSVGGRILVNGTSCNRYCYFHLKELINHKKILVIETEIHKDKSFKDIGCDYICIPLRFIKILNLFKPLKNTHNIEIKKLKTLIEQNFGYEIKIKSIFKEILLPQLVLFRILKFMIKSNKPKAMGFINDGNSKFFNHIAYEMNVPIFEFQHGDTSKFSMVSTYPKKVSGAIFVPDTIFLFGEYWIDRYNIKSEKKIIGSPSFEYYSKKLNRIKQNFDQVLCISVNSINFGKTIFQVAEKNKNKNYLFKLRDSEYSNWEKNYPFFTNTNNFQIIDNNDKSLYTLIKESKYIVTTISTVIYETLSLNRNVIIYKNNDYPFIEDLESKKFVQVVSNKNQLINKIKKRPPKDLNIDEYFFKKNFSKNLSHEIENFINSHST